MKTYGWMYFGSYKRLPQCKLLLLFACTPLPHPPLPRSSQHRLPASEEVPHSYWWTDVLPPLVLSLCLSHPERLTLLSTYYVSSSIQGTGEIAVTTLGKTSLHADGMQARYLENIQG